MQNIASLFAPYFDDSSTSDIVVKAGETRIHAHKIVLAAHSTLFKAMFQVLRIVLIARLLRLKTHKLNVMRLFRCFQPELMIMAGRSE